MAHEPAGRRPLAIIFDLDGTLVDSVAAITESVNVALREMGIPEKDPAVVFRMLGKPFERKCLELIGAVDDDIVERFVTIFRAHYRLICLESTRLLPGAESTLRYLAARPVALGVATTKPCEFAEMILDHLGCRQFFSVVIGPEDVDNVKPDPEPVEKAARGLGISPVDCVYVGDTPVDVEAAHAAAARCIAVCSGAYSRAELETAGADWILSGVGDIPNWLDEGGG